METSEQQIEQLKGQADNNTVAVNLTARQLGIIMAISNDKKILQDRVDDNSKREKDAVNLILDAHGIDPMSVREVQLQDGKLVVVRHPVEKRANPIAKVHEPENGTPVSNNKV